MCDIIPEHGVFVVDNSPEYKDSLDIKIDYFSDEEHEEHMRSQDTLHSEEHQVTKKANQVEKPIQNEFSNSLEDRVASRINRAYDRILVKERNGFGARSDLVSTSREEVLEFINVLTNGMKPLRVEITPAEPIKPKRKRGRPRKYPLKPTNLKKRSYTRRNKSRF